MKKTNLLDITLIIIYTVIIILMTIFVEQDYIIIITTISIFIIDKIVIPRRKDILKKETLKKKKQKFFNILVELSKLCVERRVLKHSREDEKDRRIYVLLKNLDKNIEAVKDIIIINKNRKGTTYFQTMVIKDKLHIDANIDPENSLVWYATIYLSGKANENPTKSELINEIYPILDSIKEENKLKWVKEYENFFTITDVE